MKTYCFALDLHDDPGLIEEYKRYHQKEKIWPHVLESALGHGVVSEEIYLAGNRLFMIVQTTDDFSLDAKRAADGSDPEMQKWEELMWKYQKPLPFAQAGEKWVLMEKIFEAK
ncbi:MAG: L-rhamnose mutarotase [Terracidiphilus sp.]